MKWLLYICLMLFSNHIYGQQTWYVKKNGTNSNTGLSWTEAFENLQQAIDRASADDQIWIAKGIYTASEEGDRTVYYHIDKSLMIYGGFSGTETKLSQRDPETNKTTISGEINDLDSKSDNSSRAFEMLGEVEILIDGLTIEDIYGDYDIPANFLLSGAGAILISNNGYNQIISFENCVFKGLFASNEGAVLNYSDNSDSKSSISFTNCQFMGNAAMVNASIMKIQTISPESKVLIKDCLFTLNDPQQIGNNYIKVIFNGDGNTFTLEGCSFENNTMIPMEALISIRSTGSAQFVINNSRFLNNPALGQIVHISLSTQNGSKVELSDLVIKNNNTFNPPIRIANSSFMSVMPELYIENVEISNHNNTETWHLIDLKEINLVKFDHNKFLNNWGGPLNVSPLEQDITITNCLVAYNEFRSNDFSNQFNFNNPNNRNVNFVNCTFAHNAGRKGSVVRTQFTKDNLSPGEINFTNCIFFDNEDFDIEDPKSSRLVFCRNSNINFNYCLVDMQDCSELVTIERAGNVNCGGEMIFSADPHFIGNDNFYLAFCSLAIDAGNNNLIGPETFDLDHNTRIQSEIVDLGAFENSPVEKFIGFTCSDGVVYSDWLSGLEQDISFEIQKTDINTIRKGISKFVLKSPGGCLDTLSFPVFELEGIRFEHQDKYELENAGDSVIIKIQNFSASPIDILISPEIPYEIDPDVDALRLNPVDEGKYLLAAINEYGCYHLDSIEIRIKDKTNLFYLANVFSPNGDPQNDALTLHYQGDDELVLESFSLYDRYGDQISSLPAVNFQNSLELWNGSSKGKDVQPGVYVYFIRINLNSERIDIAGTVTLIR